MMGALRPDEALVHYFVTAEIGVGFIVRDDGVRSFEIPISDESLSRRVRVARELVGNPQIDGTAAHDALRGLHELLIEPAILRGNLAGVERLIVVPHGVLTYLPFGALVNAAGRFLVEDFALQVLPSAAVLPVLRSKPSPGESALSSAIAFAPLPSTLPASRAEVKAVKGAFSRGWTVEGRRASERRFRQALAEAEVVHVATHGTLNVLNPLFSFLEFAPGPEERGENDGRLEIHEVLGLAINSSLVFLSGCETGLGASWSTEFERGEDYATLALAFLYAGADNVVATLWPVEDEGAAAFAERFYAELQHSDPVFALARAQREMLSHPTYSEPYYWAAYRLAGAGPTTARTNATAVR
jgi:CHAT domain-containing protein